MKNTKMRVISLVLVIALLVATLPLTVFATGDAEACVHIDEDTDALCDTCNGFLSEPTDGEITLGEKITRTLPYYENDWLYFSFTPAADGDYLIKAISSDGDPIVCLFDSDRGVVGWNDDKIGQMFYLEETLEAGKTYYVAVASYNADSECTFAVSAMCDEHTASETVNCLGTLCSVCGDYYGDPGDHTPDGEPDCRGTYCSVCKEFYGEGTGNHTPEGEPDCRGTYCSACESYYGEGNGNHTPEGEPDCRGTYCSTCESYYGAGNGAHSGYEDDSLCDVCDAIITDLVIEVGESKIPLIYHGYVYYKFVPTESGEYVLFSSSDYDPVLTVYGEDSQEIINADDDDGFNFCVTLDLEAGRTYYLRFYEYKSDNLCAVTINEACDVHIPDNYGKCKVCNAFAPKVSATVTLGEKTNLLLPTSEKYEFVTFTPAESGKYYIKSYTNDNSYNPAIRLFLANGLEDTSDDDVSGEDYNFYLEVDLTAGETYYLGVYERIDNATCTLVVKILCDEHTASETVNCLGTLCSVCGDYYGDPGDHTPDGDATCLGTWCSVCGDYYGEAGDHTPDGDATCLGTWCSVCEDYYGDPGDHTPDGDATCLGTYCSVCEDYYGAGNGVHSGYEDDGWCDVCGVIITELIIAEGKSEIALKADKAVLYKFIPTVSGTYLFTSNSSYYDPKISIYDADSVILDYSDNAILQNFYLEIALEAGKLYFVCFYEYSNDNNCPVYIRTLCAEHTSSGVQTCKGYSCTVCEGYFGDAIDHTYDYTYDEYDHWIECTFCGIYASDDQYGSHEFDENGECVCGYTDHAHTFVDAKIDGLEHRGVCSVCNLNISERHAFTAEGVCACGRERFDEGIYLGTTLLRDGQYLDNNGNVSTSQPEGGYAYLKDGVLTLNNFELENYDENPIYGSSAIYSEIDLTVILIGESRLAADDDDCVYIFGANLIIDGEGKLNVCCEFDGIDINDGNLTVNGGNITIDAGDDGIYDWEGDVNINGGTITIDAGDDGIDVEKGKLTVNGGNITIDAGDDGIYDWECDVNINGGTITIDAGDDGIDINDGKFTVNGGNIIIDSDDHGFDVSGELEINDGFIKINAGDDGMDIDDGVINGGILYIIGEDNGIDASDSLTVNGGTFYVETDDDNGIEAYALTINGGIFEIDANDHCFESSGTITVNGGQFTLDPGSGEEAFVAIDGIVFGENMGEQNVVENEYGEYVWADADGNTFYDSTLYPSDAEIEKIITAEWISTGFDGSLDVCDSDGNKLVIGTDYELKYLIGNETEVGRRCVMVSGIGDYTGSAIVSYIAHKIYEITLDDPIEITLAGSTDTVDSIVKFTPKASATYVFDFSVENYAWISMYDSNGLLYNSNGAVRNEHVEIELIGGETYYFRFVDSDHGSLCEASVEVICPGHTGGEATYTEQAICEICGDHYGDFRQCRHMCHADGIRGIIWKVFDFVYDFLGVESECECGADH